MRCLLSAAWILAKPRRLSSPPQKGRPYKFEYGVVDDYVGANYGHDESSDGELVQGSYYVVLPDGRFQTVIMFSNYFSLRYSRITNVDNYNLAVNTH